jgi:hypothetical protein
MKVDIRRFSTADAIRAGSELIEAKRQLGHGRFMAWLRSDFGRSLGMARRLMRVARRLAKFPEAACLPVSVAYELSSPKVAPEEIEAAIVSYSSGLVVTEASIISMLAKILSADGPVETEVDCGPGRADIVTRDAVIEVERVLDRHSMFCAIGQVLVYRQAIDPGRKAVVAGMPDWRKESRVLHRYAKEFGVEVWEVG